MIGKCPFCGEEYEVEDSCYGRMAECPSCHRKFIVGQAEAEASPKADTLMQRDANDELISLLKQIKAGLRYLLIVGVLVVICQIVSCSKISTTSDTCTAIGIMLNSVNENVKDMYQRMGRMKLY